MKKILLSVLVMMTAVFSMYAADSFQLTNANFEDWSAAAFDGQPQPKGWNASNVEQFGFKFNFAHKESGHNGGYCMMVQDQDVGAAGITETSPGYFSLGQPWAYVPGLTSVGQATAGTSGGQSWTHRPDSMSVWIKRTGNNWDKEDFYLLYYAWSGTARGDKYKNKNKSCTNHSETNEESDVRQALNGNECGTSQKVTQVAEGMWRERKNYGNWTNVRVPIYYFNDDAPTMMNIIFSASNYPNFRANDGLYAGNSLYVDDVELIYSSKIQKLYVGGEVWNGFDPNSTAVQTYPLGENATTIPAIKAMRGAGSLTNAKGTTVPLPGRTLSGSEITVVNGDLVSTPTTITVRSEDGKSTTVYKIQFQKAASTNVKLAGISVNGTPITGFSATKFNYNIELPYGTTAAPVVTADKQEEKQTVKIIQATSPTGTAVIKVTAADGKTTQNYTLNFKIGLLADNTLAGIRVNGKDIPGFTPSQTIYKVSLPVGTSVLPTIEAVSAYPAGEQTIEYVLPTLAGLDGGSAQIKVTTPGNQTAKVYKLNFKLEASSYTYLQDIKIGGVSIEGFEPTTLTYYVNLPLGTTTLPAITWTQGDEYQTVVLSGLADGVLDGTARLVVTAGNGTDKSTYKIVFSTEKSEISYLSDIKIGGVSLDGFRSDVTSYIYQLPIGTTTLPEITWVKGDEFEEVTMTPGGVNGTTRITVKAGNGNTTIYLITFTVDAYTDNTLRMIYIGGDSLQGFNPETNEYSVQLAKGTTTLPVVSFDKQDDNLQTVSVRSGGLNGDYKITVRPQSGSSRTYIIHFSVDASSNNRLQMIYVDGQPLAGFHTDTLLYIDSLPEGVSTIPTVTYQKGEDSQRVLSVLEDVTQTITVTAENGEKRVYTIQFVIKLSANAFLQMIYLDGTPIETPFDSSKVEYWIPLESNVCPAITVDKNPGQQVTLSTPVGAGTAVILVAPEMGATNTYKIHFEPVAAATVQLQSLLLDSVQIAGFAPTTMHYAATYEKTLPQVGYVLSDSTQTASVVWTGNKVWVIVTDTNDVSATYDITFTRTYLGNATLAAILADSDTIPGFRPDSLRYAYHLAAGSTYPALNYTKGDDSQSVVFGQAGEGRWQWFVTAENGDTARYEVAYDIALYSDATPENIQLVGLPGGQSFTYDPTQTTYTGFTLDEGAALPDIVVTARPKQRIVSVNVSETEQRVLVTAENGDQNTYTITYTRTQSSNALLADILIDGVSLQGFDPAVHNYIDTIAWRSRVIPNVFPVAALPTQTVVTELSRPNGTTTITVTSQDGTESTVYTIAFPVRKSGNVALESLYAYDAVNDETYDLDFKPGTTEYVVELPYQATACPSVIWEKQETEQRIDFISRPMGDTTEVRVTAENGDSRTYKIFFKETLSAEPNRLSMIRIVELDQELSLKDKTQREFAVNMPFGSRTLTVEVAKMYPEQTVFIQPGGVNNPTVITVKSNRPGEADEVYTITPTVPTEDPAVLTDIKVNGTTIAGFQKEQFSYIVKVTDKPILRYTLNKGAEINILDQTMKHWKAEVTYGEGALARTNIYEVWYYYQNDQVPNMDFTEWESAQVTTSAQKPTGWNVLGDFAPSYTYLTFTFTPGGEVQQDGSSAAYLHTQYNSAPLAGYVPGYMTLGNIEYHYQRWGSSAFSISGGITFRNTPDVMSVRYRNEQVNNNSRILYTLNGSGGETTILHEDATTTNDYVTKDIDLSHANEVAEVPTQLNITFNSFDSESGKNGTVGGDAKMHVDWLKFTYNHTLTKMTVDGINATKSGNAFTATLTDAERIELPILAFTGEVSDQARTVNWSAPTKSGDYEIRNATIRNYAENGTDKTDYTLQVKRPLCKKNWLGNLLLDSVTITGFATDKLDYTVNLAAKAQIPDVYPVPASSRQTITTSFDATTRTMTITVTPEAGAAQTYTVQFVNVLSDDTELAVLKAGDEVLNVTEHSHTITKAYMPDITYTKKSDLQQVEVNNGVITVRAENGAVGTYTITRNDTVPVLGNAYLKDFELDDTPTSELGNTNFSTTKERPGYVKFTRVTDDDAVVFTQTPTQMTWAVTGNENHTYTLTYPNEVSSNAQLAGILLNGVPYSEFIPSVEDYTSSPILSDSVLVVFAQLAESAQTVETSQTYGENGLDYTMTVTAQDGVSKKTYKLRIVRPQSNDQTLQGIYVDGTLISGFRPDSTDYTIVLPSPAVKTAQPQMPSITYLAGHVGQSIEMIPGSFGVDEPTSIMVNSQAGSIVPNEYKVTVLAEPSHCADLTGIFVNGVALDHFEPGRHFYSVELNTSDIEIVPASDDRFQKDTVLVKGTTHTLRITAEDGVTTSDYAIDIFVQTLSNDATLSAILLEQNDSLVEMVDFMRSLNPTLKFDPMQHSYTINLPSGTTIVPGISTRLKMDGQKVDIAKSGMVVTITVTAVDGTKNTYTLNFETPKSTNADLSMIFIDGDSLAGFQPNYYFYQLNLPVGTHSLPEVVGQKSEARQTIKDVEYDQDKLQAIIKVQAEDPMTRENTYVVVFHYTQSDADTLGMVFVDGDSLLTFQPHTFYYSDSLAVGTTAFPDLSWAEADDYQTIWMDTVVNQPSELIRRIHVVSESGKRNTYMFNYTILKSSVDTLRMIYLDTKELPGFQPTVNEYYYQLTAAEANALAEGQLPNIDYLVADEWQTVLVSQAKDSLSGKSLGYKSVISVTAPSGAMRIYTIHYPVETSHDATLNMIMLAGKPLANFDAEKDLYRVEWDPRSALPVTTVVKKENAQTYEFSYSGDTIQIDVWAEDKVTTMQYVIIFDRQYSDDAHLQNITIEGHREFRFDSEITDYVIDLPFGEDTIPAVEVVKLDSMQIVPDTFPLETLANGDVLMTIHVVAPDGEGELDYVLTFRFGKNNDALLKGLYLNDTLVAGFNSYIDEYVYEHPFGTDSTALFGVEDVRVELSDSLATDTIYVAEDGTIYITVIAHDGVTENTYIITQKIGKDADNYLAAIYVADELIRDFDPETTFYTYLLADGKMPPVVTAEARSENARLGEIPVVQAGDTCEIVCTADNGDKRRYYIHFAVSTINAAAEPTASDVVLKRLPGTYSIFVATIRNDIFFILYDQYGQVVYANSESLPVANPNDVEVASDPNRSNGEQLANVIPSPENGAIIDLNPGEIYLYGFYQTGKKLIKSGKLIAR